VTLQSRNLYNKSMSPGIELNVASNTTRKKKRTKLS